MGKLIKSKQIKTVLKRSSAVVVSGKLSKKQKVMYNVILSHTRRALKLNPAEVSFSCPAPEFFNQVQIDKDSWVYAKKILKGIQSVYLEKDTLGLDGSGEWFMENLIISSKIKDGVVHWGMSNNMINLIRDSRDQELIHPYVIVDLLIQHNFTKHGLTLYELGLHWLPRKANYGRSGWLELEQVRELFNVKYPSFAKLNQDVLQSALNSVNDPSSGSPFTVELQLKKVGKFVKYALFIIERKNSVDENIIEIENPSEFITGLLLTAGLHLKTIRLLVERIEKADRFVYFSEKISTIVDRYKNHKGADKVKAITGAINSELNQLPLPFEAKEKGVATRINNETDIESSAQECYANKGDDCVIRQRGLSNTNKCSRCFDLHELPPFTGVNKHAEGD